MNPRGPYALRYVIEKSITWTIPKKLVNVVFTVIFGKSPKKYCLDAFLGSLLTDLISC